MQEPLMHAVLLVEDSPGDADLVKEILGRSEFRVDVVDRLAAGLEALSRKPYDLLLLDLGLPDASGVEAVESVARRHPDLPVVVLTGLADEKVALRALRAGAQDFMVKGELDPGRAVRTLYRALVRKEVEIHKSQLLTVISHEMRTPLNFILGAATCLEDEVAGPLSAPQQKLVKTVLEGADRLLELIDDLLDSAQILAGRFEVLRAPTALEPILREVVASLESLAHSKGIALDVAETADAVVLGEARRVMQVVANLVSNALRFTPDGGTVTVRCTRSDSQVRVEVSDTGTGIPEEDRERIFHRFSQLQKPGAAMRKGMGLGLSICKAIVEALGGRIGVEGPPQGGATFWFTLPLHAEARPALRTAFLPAENLPRESDR